MIDINLIRDNPEVVSESLKRRGENDSVVEQIRSLDALWRKQTQKLELLQAESNRLSKTKELALENKDRLSSIKEEINSLKSQVDEGQAKLQAQLMSIPNIVADGVPSGGEDDSEVIHSFGSPSKEVSKSHEDILVGLGQLDLETASSFSGSRYRYLIGDGAYAARKLFSEAIDFAIKNGFVFVIPPVVARSELLESTGFFPAGKEDTFFLGDDAYLSGTSEPLLLALAANKKFKADSLPLRYVGFSTCFRKEAGSYGKDVKGMFRTHQFDKVEMVSVVSPEDSEKEHQFLVSMQQEFVERFGLAYQTVLKAAGDQSQIASKQIDVECWFPSQQRYRETHSASNCSDYQSRSLKIKVDGEQTVLAHTLNATLATERLLLAIVENGSTDSGLTYPKELIS